MLFLIIFEAVFVIGRIVSEDRVEVDQFRQETDRIAQALDRRGQPPPRLTHPRIEMNFVMINAS
jgi:hypothetical protein